MHDVDGRPVHDSKHESSSSRFLATVALGPIPRLALVLMRVARLRPAPLALLILCCATVSCERGPYPCIRRLSRALRVSDETGDFFATRLRGGHAGLPSDAVQTADEAVQEMQEGAGQLREAAGLMAGLDGEIEKAQAKLEEMERHEGAGQQEGALFMGADRENVMDALVPDTGPDASMRLSPVARVRALQARKSELEAAIDKQIKDLDDMGAPAAEVGNFWETHVPLVDAEGFPRGDLAIEEVGVRV